MNYTEKKYKWHENKPLPNIGQKFHNKDGWLEVKSIDGDVITFYLLRTFHNWAGMPKGIPEDRNNCVEAITPLGRGVVSQQCSRKRGFGEDGLYCKTHAKYHPSEGKDA